MCLVLRSSFFESMVPKHQVPGTKYQSLSTYQPNMASLSYLQLLKQNPNYRRLWLGQVISQMGDWLYSAAMYSLVESLTGSGRAVAWVIVLQFLPYFVLSPISGVIADRFPRRAIMIFADLMRAVTVLGLLLVRRPEHVWMVYVVVGMTDVMSALFEPARQALLPSLCKREELFTANALSSLTWSMTLAIGAGVGGFITLAVGREATFVLDSLSFLCSAYFIWQIKSYVRTEHLSVEQFKARQEAFGIRSSLNELGAGLAYVWQRPVVLSYLLVKTSASLGGGFLVLFTIFGQRLFPIGKTGTAIALLYAARGLGTALGPVIARRVGGETPVMLRRGIGWAFLIYGSFYVLFGQAPSLPVAMCLLVGAHIGGSIQWVNSTVLLQLSVPDEFRGRVFALEWGLLTLAGAISNYTVGWLVDNSQFSPRMIASGIGIYLMLPGLAWVIVQWFMKNHYAAAAQERSLSPS